MSIVVKKVSKTFGQQKALDNVSFTVNKGDIVGFIGPNGAGKTTIMRIITGYLPPDSGEVLVDEKNVMENSLEIRKNIGYLPENNPLYLEMYVKEYMEYVAGLYKIRNKSLRIKEIIAQTGLEIEQNKKIGVLSKGYRQRVGLAQALIHDPKVLILDEPTSGLDPNQIIEIRNLISEVGKDKTIMLSTHIMQEVEAICDKVIIINRGKIVADDFADNLRQQNKELYQTVIVEFNGRVGNSELLGIGNVVSVKNLKDNQWLLQSPLDKDIRPDIFNFAVQKGIAVISLQKREVSLEDVFRELTMGG